MSSESRQAVDVSSTAYLRAVEEQVLLLQRPSMQTVKRKADLRGQVEADAHFRRTLELASPYYWAWHICEMVEVSAMTVPEWKLKAEDLVTPYGFSWFACPLPLYDPYKQKTPKDGGGNHWMVGFCWGPDGVGGVWVYSLYQAKPAIMITGQQVGGYVKLGRGFCWRFDETIRDAIVSPPSPKYQGRIFRELDYLSASFLFLNQRIIRVDTRSDARYFDSQGRPTRVDADPNPLVRTVQLRRTAVGRDHEERTRQIDWSHRWLVSAHWRQQWYPSLDEHRPVLVSPYMKGPEDKPLKVPGVKVFEVVR